MSSPLYEASTALLADYPLAVRGGQIVLAIPDGDTIRPFILGSGSDGACLIRRWAAPGSALIEADSADTPDWAAEAVTRGIPLPADGSLLGWLQDGTVTAVIPFYAHGDGLPSWSLMPEADAAQWPPFAGERIIGPWLWEHYHAGRLIDLGPVIAASEDVVFWVDTTATLGSGCIAVARYIGFPYGNVLPPGRYAYLETLRSGMPVPSLSDLLADEKRVDLGPRFPVGAFGA